jgi:superfamily I DNA/RNA helicase
MSSIELVHGPPGTGKTTHLAQRARAAAAAHGPERVAIVSLTRAAAAEIGGRELAISGDGVGTLHAACHRGLDRPRLAETTEALRAFSDAHPALRLSSARGSLEEAPGDPDGAGARTTADRLLRAVTAHRARRTQPSTWSRDERAFAATWEDWKRQTRRRDFTDLIELALAELPAHPLAPAALLLDEAQDFSRLELALARRWAAAAETTVICGDSDQALYQWRGAEPGALAETAVDGTRTLTQSHRVPRAVHALATRWLEQLPDRAPAAYRPTAAAGAVARLPISLRHPDLLAAELERDVAAGRSAMVLTSCGYLLGPVLHLLRERGVAFHNPYRAGAHAWNPLRARGALTAFLRPSAEAWGAAARKWTWGDLQAWTAPLTAGRVLARGARALIDAKCQPDALGGSRAAEEVPLEVLCTLLADGGPRHPAFALDVAWWASRLRAAEARRHRAAIELLHARGAAALRSRPRVVVGTIHSVKGGEADVVYLFPDLSRQGMWSGWHAGGAPRDQVTRMVYVALTRARERVVLLDASGPEHVAHELLQAARAAAAIDGGGR